MIGKLIWRTLHTVQNILYLDFLPQACLNNLCKYVDSQVRSFREWASKQSYRIQLGDMEPWLMRTFNTSAITMNQTLDTSEVTSKVAGTFSMEDMGVWGLYSHLQHDSEDRQQHKNTFIKKIRPWIYVG